MANDETEAAHRHHDRHDAWFNKQNETTIQSGTLAIRTTFLLNGGACLALLAFMANTLTATGLSTGQQSLLATILPTLGTFAWGAFLSVVAICIGYLVNRCYLESAFRDTRTYTSPYVEKTNASHVWLNIGNALNILAVLTTVVALVAFLVGLLTISGAVS